MKTIKAAVMAALVAGGAMLAGSHEASAQGFSLSFGRGGFYAGPSYGYGYGGYGGYGNSFYGPSYGYSSFGYAPSYGYSNYGYSPYYYGGRSFGRRGFISPGYGYGYGGIGRHGFGRRGFDFDDD
jgi:hypothetical protein